MRKVAAGIALCVLAVSVVRGQAPSSFAVTHATCPPQGKHKQNGVLVKNLMSSDDGLRNMAKRHLPAGSAPLTLTVPNFGELQADIDQTFGNAATKKTLFHPTRLALQHLATSNGSVSEGDLVQLSAFIVETHPGGATESTNCGGEDGRDIHINVGAKNGTEFEGVVVEMIPQLPHLGWNRQILNKVRDKKLPVLVVGGLTYDNEHLVNKDPHHVKGGQPHRITLWEIHPVTAFFVCETASCDPDNHTQWTMLSTWATNNH